MLAAENRTSRRVLSKALVGFVINTPPDMKCTRVVMPTRPGRPYYVFLAVPHLPSVSYEDYREVRRRLLEAYMMVIKLMYPDAQDVVGVATEAGKPVDRSEDVMHLDARSWTDEQQREARSLQQDLSLLTQVSPLHGGTEYEFPTVPGVPPRRNVGRNEPCPCGSGRKFKNCHRR
jgi:hypothetical protein